MTLKEWVEFNKNICKTFQLSLKVMRKHSLNKNDNMFQTIIRVDDAVEVFGDYKILLIQPVCYEEISYLGFIVYND